MTEIWAKCGEGSTPGGQEWPLCQYRDLVKPITFKLVIMMFFSEYFSELTDSECLTREINEIQPFSGIFRYFQIFWSGPIWELYITLILPLIILGMIILTTSDIHQSCGKDSNLPDVWRRLHSWWCPCVDITGSCFFFTFHEKNCLKAFLVTEDNFLGGC